MTWRKYHIINKESDLTTSEFSVIRTTALFCALRSWWSYYRDQQDAVKEQYNRGTQTKVNQSKFIFKHGLNNTKYLGYLKCFKIDVKT
jgi:hypothetical protein